MFNSLASYLLGTTTTATSTQPQQLEQEDRAGDISGNHHQEQLRNVRLTSVVDDDDDWVVVDRDSEGNSELSSEESECEPNLTDDLDEQYDTLLSRASSSSSLRGAAVPSAGGAMEESWFLTPPPCFVSAGPVHMETSPLENLLIEHPSMSVYQQPPLRRAAANAGRPASPLEPVEDLEEGASDVDVDDDLLLDGYYEMHRRLQRSSQPRPNRVEAFQRQQRQGSMKKQSQKVQIQKACQSLKRGYLERNNKAREVSSRNQRLRRGERSQGATRSHANNNRKCC